MLLIIGLGNPGAKYAGNRHNVGFQLVDAMADFHNFGAEKQKFQGLIREGFIENEDGRRKALILKPQTYYNEAGRCVGEAVKFFKIDLDDIVVFHDELDLAPGKVKVKRGGGTGGNNGLKSIAAHISPDFRRVRIGIGHPGSKEAVTPWVLGDFSKHEKSDWLKDLSYEAARALPKLMLKDDPNAKFMSAIAQTMIPQRKGPKTVAEGMKQTQDKIKDQQARKHASEVTTPQQTPEPKSKNAFGDVLGKLLNKKEK